MKFPPRRKRRSDEILTFWKKVQNLNRSEQKGIEAKRGRVTGEAIGSAEQSIDFC